MRTKEGGEKRNGKEGKEGKRKGERGKEWLKGGERTGRGWLETGTEEGVWKGEGTLSKKEQEKNRHTEERGRVGERERTECEH